MTGPLPVNGQARSVVEQAASLFRVTDAERNGPRGEDHIRLQAPLHCSPCLKKESALDEECGRSLTLQQVFEAEKALLLGKATP